MVNVAGRNWFLKKTVISKKKPDILPYNATFFVPISPAEFKVKNRKYAEKDTSKIFGCYFFSILWKNCRWNLVLLFSPNEATAWYNLTVMTGIQYCSWGKRYELNMNEDRQNSTIRMNTLFLLTPNLSNTKIHVKYLWTSSNISFPNY